MNKNRALIDWSWREIKLGQLWPVLVALTLIIASVVALASLALRVENVMDQQGRNLLAADLAFKSANPVPQPLIDKANQLNLTSSLQTKFRSMAFSEKGMQLVTVRSVGNEYPLRGQLTLEDEKQQQKHHVAPGELWLSARLFSLLDVDIGEQIAIGDAELTISGVIKEQPELIYNPFNTIPYLFIHQQDLPKTGAVQLGGRVSYRFFVNGPSAALKQLQESYQLQAGEDWIDENSQGRTAQLLEKAKQYLSLTILMVILMAAVTLVLTCSHYVQNRTETVAMLKSMGASRAWLRYWLTLQVGLMFIIAFVAGSLIGSAIELLLRIPLADILPEDIPSVGWLPFAYALLVAICVGLPALLIPLFRLLDTPAVNVIQAREVKSSYKAWWLLLLPIGALLVSYGNNLLVWIVFAGLMLLFLLLAAISLLLLKQLARFKLNASMSLALSRINRSTRSSLMQLAALSGSLMLVALIWLIKVDLLGDWQQNLAPDAPNVFAFNISPDEQENYLNSVDKLALPRSDSFAIIRGRISDINEQSVEQFVEQHGRSYRILEREVNFTWAKQLPSYNELIAGQWTTTKGVSVEQDVANDLGVKVGDTLSFVVNSQKVTATVNSIRAVKWQSMQPNFIFIFTEDVIAELPATWMLSFRVEADQDPLLNSLARDYATVSLLDFRTVLVKIQSLLKQISYSLTGLASLGVLSGVLLIFTLLRLSLNERKREITLYRTLGASKDSIKSTLWAEYGLLTISAGLVAALAAEVILFSLMKWGFQLPTQLHPALWLVLPVLALVIVIVCLRTVIKELLRPLK